MSRRKGIKKWVLNREVHLGFIKETFQPGTVLEVDTINQVLCANGREFKDIRDIEILQRLDFLEPYSVAQVKAIIKTAASSDSQRLRDLEKEPRDKQRYMEVVKSDADLMGKEIDIRYTKTPKKEAKVKGGKLPVIRGDETFEERRARLSKLHPIISQMPIVVDDSLGVDDDTFPSRNTGSNKTGKKKKVARRKVARRKVARRKSVVKAKAKAKGKVKRGRKPKIVK